METELKDLVGQTWLVEHNSAEAVEIKAVSPDGKYVKLGYGSWYKVTDCRFIVEDKK